MARDDAQTFFWSKFAISYIVYLKPDGTQDAFCNLDVEGATDPPITQIPSGEPAELLLLWLVWFKT